MNFRQSEAVDTSVDMGVNRCGGKERQRAVAAAILVVAVVLPVGSLRRSTSRRNREP